VSGLRFCFLTTFYPPFNFGGDGIGIQRLARGLARSGHHVTVIHDVDAYNLLHKGPEPRAVPEIPGIDVVSLRSGLGALSPLLTQQTGRPVANGRRIRRILAEGEYDVINFHNISLIGGPGILKYGNSLKLYMAHEHWLVCPMHVLWRHGRELCTGRQCFRCTLSYRRPPQVWRWTGFLERELRHVDTVIAMSDFSRQKHAEFGLTRPMEVLPYFLADPEPAGTSVAGPAPHPRPYFLFVGRLEKIKGLDDVIPLFREYPDADLLIAGDGEYAEVLKGIGAGIENVRFLGRVTPEDLRRYYQHAIALIVPSVCFETFGIILIEAFRQSTPVIARRIGPFPEIVEGARGGELFTTGAELVQAMRRLQADPAYRRAKAESAYRAYEAHYCETVVVPQYLEIVKRAALRTGRERLASRIARRPDGRTVEQPV
jgi:glycosyltransferase involved in cell wall biosynthesis